MNASSVLALLVAAFFLIGLGSALARLARHPESAWIVILGLICLFGLGILYFTLRAPYFGAVKAFHGLPAIAAFCALGAAGWARITPKSHLIRIACWTLLLLWAGTTYAAFWIRPNNPQIQIALGLNLSEQQNESEAVACLSQALQIDQVARAHGQAELLPQARAQAHQFWE